MGFVSELIAPGPKPTCQVVKVVLPGEAHGAVHLVGNIAADVRGLPHARLGGGGFKARRAAKQARKGSA